jgi:hypothetical protein
MILRLEHNNQYITKIPSAITAVQARLKTGVELLRLKQGKRKWTGNNLELRYSLPFLIYSPYSERYWYRVIEKGDHLSPLIRYIRDGNLYIIFDRSWQIKVSEEREQEGKSYYDYNKLRELILLQEATLRKEVDNDTEFKLTSIQLEINKINKRYGK